MPSPIDWRTLYEQNQAAIRASGVSLPSVPSLPSLPSPPPAPGVIGGERLLARPGEPRTFTVGGRARQALVYAPPGVGIETPAPLVCMLHGCTQDPRTFAAAAIHPGLAYGAASDVASAYAAMANGAADPAGRGRAAHAALGSHARAVPTIVVHGTADRTVAPVNAHQVLRQAMTANRLAAPECRELDEHRPASVADGHTDGGLAFTSTRGNDPGRRPSHDL